MKVLITGASGMLGHRLALEFASVFDVYVTQYQKSTPLPGCRDLWIDITQPIESSFKPDLVIHTAALTDVDYCQRNPDEAWKVNVTGTHHLIKAFPRAKFVYISTDFVFDGADGNYTETDRPRPINVYAQTKYVGELLVPESGLIVRTCIFGHNLPGFKESLPEKILRQLRANEPVSLFDDLYSTPIYTGSLARLLLGAVASDLSGVWNIAGSERVSKYQFGLMLADLFELDPGLLSANQALTFPFEAERPRDVSLNTTKIAKTAGLIAPDLRQSLVAFKEERNRWN
jgi:dTDP-4-dehydrorhamnose reductase